MVKSLPNPFLGAPTPLGSLITAAGQRLSAHSTAPLQNAGFPDLRAAHAPVFMAIESEGTRPTTLATRARMSKQAAGELIRHHGRGYLSVAADPADHRATLVTLTAQGWRAIAVGKRAIGDFDAWLERRIGADAVTGLRRTLTPITATDTSAPAR